MSEVRHAGIGHTVANGASSRDSVGEIRFPNSVRLRASVEWEIWQGTLTLTTDEKDQLLDFWRTDCARGTAEYQVLHWTSIGTEVTVRWGDIPGPIEHVAKDYWRVGIHWIKMP